MACLGTGGSVSPAEEPSVPAGRSGLVSSAENGRKAPRGRAACAWPARSPGLAISEGRERPWASLQGKVSSGEPKGRPQREKAAVCKAKDERALAKPDRKADKSDGGQFSQVPEKKRSFLWQRDGDAADSLLVSVLACVALAFSYCWFCLDPRKSRFYPVHKYAVYHHISLHIFYVCASLFPMGNESADQLL